MMTSVGEYKQVSDTVSDLNVMIAEAPVDNKYKRQLADIVYEREKFIFDLCGYDKDSWKV